MVLMRAATPSRSWRTSALLRVWVPFFTETACMRTMLTSRVRLLAMR